MYRIYFLFSLKYKMIRENSTDFLTKILLLKGNKAFKYKKIKASCNIVEFFLWANGPCNAQAPIQLSADVAWKFIFMFAVVRYQVRRCITVADQVGKQKIWKIKLLLCEVFWQLASHNIGPVGLVPADGKRMKGFYAVQPFIIGKNVVANATKSVCIFFYLVFPLFF